MTEQVAEPVVDVAVDVAADMPADPFSAASEALVCELVLGDRRHGL